MYARNIWITTFHVPGSHRVYASILRFSKSITVETYGYKNHVKINI